MERVGIEVGYAAVVGGLPVVAEQGDSQVENALGTREFPAHARKFESLCNEALASGFGDAAAQWYVVLAVLEILHVCGAFADVVVSFVEVFFGCLGNFFDLCD